MTAKIQTIYQPLSGISTGTITLDSSEIFKDHVTRAVNFSGQGIDVGSGDIKIRGESLSEFMQEVRDRLGILVPNPELESQWEELKLLAQQYRALEADIKERMKTWDGISREY